MNKLSWLIYLADIADDLDWFLSAGFVISALLLVGTIVSCTSEDGRWDEKDWALWRKFFWRSLVASVIAFAAGSFVPSKETVYAIAASEVGEAALKSETGSKAFSALNAWLDRQSAAEKVSEEDGQ